ncbi:hypothetical protein AX17_003107 [Amanita inopinata Kibby_2008]|nr:hypothetical protein AX17_003107 [Amanita inopinata Kibby_2008]
MAGLDEAYSPAIALEGWSYARYVGPFARPQAEQVFLCVRRGELVVATGREPSKLWYIHRLRATEDYLHRNACSLRREGTQRHVSYSFPKPGDRGEVALGPEARFDMLRIKRMKKPCYIRVYQEPPEEKCCEPEGGDAEGATDNAEASERAAEAPDVRMADEEERGEEEPDQPSKPQLEWYLGVSEDLKVVLKVFPPESECTTEQTGEKPIWEFVTRDEAVDEEIPQSYAPAWNPRLANDPRHREFYTHPDRFNHDRGFWPAPGEPRKR